MSRITNLKRPIIDLQATGKQIKSLMNVGKITVRDLQGLFGFEYPQAIYAWEQGKNIPSIDNLLVLSNLFACRVEEIVQVHSIEIQIACADEMKLEKAHKEAEPCEGGKFKKIA